MLKGKKKKLLVLYTATRKSSSLSYIYGYPNAFAKSDLFDVTLCNFGALKPKRWMDRFRVLQDLNFDAIVMLHTTSHQMYYFWQEAIERSGAPIVWFIGNEFRGMPSKMEFAKDLNIAMMVTQSISPQVINKYHDHLGCKVIGMPVSCYDEKMFTPGPPIKDRPIDIGYRGARGPAWLGHWDREVIAEVIEEAAGDRFKLDLSLDMDKRLKWRAWRDFLQNSKTQLCVSSGGEIFELTDETRLKMEAYVTEHPNYTRDEILTLLPPVEERIRLRVLGSRMMEAAATGTPQIMYNDDFDGPMEPDRDYIALDKSHANINDVLDRVNDYGYLTEIADNCRATLKGFANYDRYLSDFDKALNDIL